MQTATIDRKRLAEVKKRGLDSGAHSKVEDGMCAAAAGDAAWAAARAAAWDAAWDAARDAAGDAAGDAAWDAARDAAGDAAWDAARAAAWAAARAKLAPTKAELQKSAIKLVERMCALSVSA